MAERVEKERETGRRLGGRPPAPPVPGPHDGDQYNFTDPEARIMKNPTNAGFEQDYNVQIAVDQESLLIVGTALSNHPNDSHEKYSTFTGKIKCYELLQIAAYHVMPNICLTFVEICYYTYIVPILFSPWESYPFDLI